MNGRSTPTRHPLSWPSCRSLIGLALAVLAPLALLSLGRLVERAVSPDGGFDFHSYWYFGHFVRQGHNPYQVFAEGGQLRFPIHYLDGATTPGPNFAQPGLATTPANTAPMLLLLSPLAWFSWPAARNIWLVVNLALLLAIPWLLLRLLPPGVTLSRGERWLVALAFYAFQATRVAAWLGQTSLLVFALMLVALRLRNRPWPAGLLLGLALSKYSLALPALLIVLLERRWRLALIAGAVQLAGLLAVVALGSYSVIEVTAVYLALLLRHAAEPGIHLASLFAGQPAAAATAVGLATLATLAFIWRGRRELGRSDALVLSLLAALSLWALLVAYHRSYDAFMAIAFVALALGALANWPLSRRTAVLLAMFLVASIGLLSLPGEALASRLGAWGPRWLGLVDGALTIALVAMLAGSLWLFDQQRRVEARPG